MNYQNSFWLIFNIFARRFSLAGDLPPHPSGRPVRLTFNLIYFIEQHGSNGRPALRTFPAHPVPTDAEK